LSPRTRATGTFVYNEGQTADRVWFVKKGTVLLSRESTIRGGESVAWAVRRPGNFVGIEALVKKRYADTARAVTDVTLCGAERPEFDTWLGASDSPARAILRVVLDTHANDAPRRASSDGNAVRRTALWVLEESPRAGMTSLPRCHVAQLLGMLPETFSRALAVLAERGAIELTRRDIRIRDVDALESLVCVDEQA
jgi:CRP-like cAMP-binding protein